MNIVLEIKPRGYFAAAARTVDATDQEAAINAALPADRRAAIVVRLQIEMRKLIESEPAGRC